MGDNLYVLSTSPLPMPLVNKAAEAGMVIDSIPFIRIEAVTDNGIKEELEEFAGLPLTAVFTSANAVRAVAEAIQSAGPAWNIYCVGNATTNEALERFGNCFISGTANDAATLAGIIITHDVQEVVFFCGDKRMDTLPGLLLAEEISVYEVVVYKTIETPQVATKAYDGILFFSPSGVNSFFKVNTIGASTVLFAIGNTTVGAIKELSGNKVVVSEAPSKEDLVDKVMEYFHK